MFDGAGATERRRATSAAEEGDAEGDADADEQTSHASRLFKVLLKLTSC